MVAVWEKPTRPGNGAARPNNSPQGVIMLLEWHLKNKNAARGRVVGGGVGVAWIRKLIVYLSKLTYVTSDGKE